MAARRSSRVLKPLLYTAGAGAIGSGVLYFSYRPRDIPGSEAAAVPPPTYGEGGKFRPPQFPRIKTREEQIDDLKKSGGAVSSAVDKAKSGISGLLGGAKDNAESVVGSEEEPYDLLIIGGGATGAGIALDAATRGLKVAMVERDDFSSGTSSKSTKLVHGGVRYLEKAVWELDYNQYVTIRGRASHFLNKNQVQTSQGSSTRTTILFGYRPPSVHVAAHHDSP
jgi:glycerol-3-phosphate dehydrogenase